MKERKKPSQSWIGKSIEEIEKEAFNKGYEAGKKETIEKAGTWLYIYYPTIERCDSAENAREVFLKAMEEQL